MRRFAYLVGPDFQGETDAALKNQGEDFETAFFAGEAAALGWLSSGGALF